jgi:hypothetical protein
MRLVRIGLALALLSSLPSTASADSFLADPPPRAPKPSMTPALISTGVTALTFGVLAYSYYRFHTQSAGNILWSDPDAFKKHEEAHRELTAWRDRTIGLAVGAAVSASITGYLWSARERVRSVNITPMSGGMRVSFAQSF